MAILDFGSGRVTVMIGHRGLNNTICISGMGECVYDGFSNGAFLSPDQLSMAVGRAIASAEANSRTTINHLFIGVPGDFTRTICHDASLNFGQAKVVNEDDIEALKASANEYENEPDFSVINIQPIFYSLDDDRRTMTPHGQKSTKIGGLMSYVLAENTFIDLIDRIMSELGIESHDYISAPLAELLFLFDEVKRDQTVVLIDCGYITTDLIVARGDGILQQFSFPIGGGHISGDIAMLLNIPFAKAETLKHKVVLSLDVTAEDKYELNQGREDAASFPADIVNDIVMARLNSIGKTIAKCISMCNYDFPDHLSYYLTGGGISYIKGARDYISKITQRHVEIAAPSLPQFNRPHLSSCLGLMNMVLDNCAPPVKKGFFAKLFRR